MDPIVETYEALLIVAVYWEPEPLLFLLFVKPSGNQCLMK